MSRLPEAEEKLIREMIARTLPGGGFACAVDCIERLLGEIDYLRREVWKAGHPLGEEPRVVIRAVAPDGSALDDGADPLG